MNEVGEPNYGRADLVDVSFRQVYEIKSFRSRHYAVADAIWYQEHMDRDPRWQVVGEWMLGVEYLKVKKQIGLWPNDPKHEVWAEWTAPGAIAYWSKDQPRERQRVPEVVFDPDYLGYLSWLFALGGGGYILGKQPGMGKPRQPGLTYDLYPYMISGFQCPQPQYTPGLLFDLPFIGNIGNISLSDITA
jgi:hypothetical protein